MLIYSDNIISVRGTSDCSSRQLFEKRCEVVSRAGNCVADFYMENVLVVWLTGWAEWREYDEDNKKRYFAAKKEEEKKMEELIWKIYFSDKNTKIKP